MTAEIQLPDVPLRDLEQRWGLSRNGLKARARALGVELRRVSSTLTTWPGAYIDLGDQLDDHLKAGRPMGTFPALAPASESSAIAKPKAGDLEGVALAIAKAMGNTLSLPVTPIDPLRRARGLAEAADAGLVLTSADLTKLGVSGINKFQDGEREYGYVFHKHKQRNIDLWTIERAIGKPATASNATAVTSRPSIGFGAIEAQFKTLSTIVELPRF